MRIDVTTLPHQQQVLIWVTGRLQLLIDSGHVGGGKISLAPIGIHLYDQLDSTGFRPLPGEVRSAIAALNEEPEREIPQELVELVRYHGVEGETT